MNIEEMIKKENKFFWILYKSAIKKAQKSIQNDEQVIYATIVGLSYCPVNEQIFDNKNMFLGGAGQIRKTLNGILIITNKRILYIDSRLGITEQKQMRIEDISSIEKFVNLGMGELRIKGITEMFILKINKINNKNHPESIEQAIEKAQELNKNNNNPRNSSSSTSNADEIRKYKQLYDDGIITQEEFEKKKRELL